MRTYQIIAEYSKKLTLEQQKQILEAIEGMLPESELSDAHLKQNSREATNKKTTNPNCPYCLSDKVNKMGTRNGRQRYICYSCNKGFTSTTHTIIENSHATKSQWERVITDTMYGLSIDYTAEQLDLHHKTVFNMRHKFLMALEIYLTNDPVVLKEVAELDETYVLESFKGSKFGPDAKRKPRLHGEKANKRGLSDEQVCICAGVQRQGAAYASTVNRSSPSKEEISQVFEGHIESGSILFTDGAKGYKVLEATVDCAVESVDVEEQKNQKVANLNNVNSFHSFIKERYGTYRGVATKYINRYNALFSSSFRDRREMIERLCDALLTPGPVDYSHTCSEVKYTDTLLL